MTELDIYRAFVSDLRWDVIDCEDAGTFVLSLKDKLKKLDDKLNLLRIDPQQFNVESISNRIELFNNAESSAKLIGFEKRASILEYLFTSNDQMIDDQNLSYFPQRYPFTYDEFMGLYNYLSELGQSDDKNISFPESRRYFTYNDKRFIWRMLVGQGTACQLVLESKTWPQDWPMIFDESRMVDIS